MSTDSFQFTSAQELNLEHFNFTEHKFHNIEHNIDPDCFFLKDITHCCNYFSEEQFKNYSVLNGTFSVIHFNSRSLFKNISKIQDCLKNDKQFSVIGITETWLKDEYVDMVQLDGYDYFAINRPNKRGGGVALYVKSSYHCEMVNTMSFSLENVMECVTVEIKCENSKNIIISCVYRTPGSSINQFEEKMTEMYNTVKNNKFVFACGDFNIDFLNLHSQLYIDEFINSMLCMGMYPVITNKDNPKHINTY